MTEKINQKMMQARTSLILDHPFFGALSLKIKLTEDTTCENMWVDGKTIGFNPEYVKNITLSECKTLIAKLVMHCALCHHVRRGMRTEDMWNQAATHAVVPILDESNFQIPDTINNTTQYKGQSAEDIYSVLLEQPKDDNGGGGGNGDGNGDGEGDGEDDGEGEGEGNGEGKGNGNSPPGEIRDNPDGQSEANRSEQENDWRVAANQAAKAAKMMGKLPGSIADLIDDLNEPKVDWREQLQNYMGSFSKDEYTWMRPNRRFIGEDIYLPSLHSETLGEMVLAVDTSGSITREELEQFSSELNSILESANPSKVTVIYCDTRVAHTEEFTPDEFPVKLHMHGGGGTRFAPVFEWVNNNLAEPPECLVYLTDMYCNDFGPDPMYPTLWVSTSELSEAPFGTVIQM